MKFSVVIPSFNQGKYIGRTIESVLSQNWSDVEILVIDGGSNDDTLKVVTGFGAAITYFVSEADRGQAHAVNKGIALANGDVVGWLNSDDIYLPKCFTRVAQAFRNSPSTDVVHGDRLLVSEDDGVFGWSCTSKFDPQHYGYNVCSETAFWRRLSPRVPTEGLREALRFAVDLEWFSRMYAKGAQFKKLNQFLGAFRCHSTNKSSTMQDVCASETETEWTRIFANPKWAVPPPIRRIPFVLAPLLHPTILGFPYLRRRIIEGKRGI